MTEAEAFKVMGLPQSADDARIKAKFRDLAQIHHPDKNQGRTEAWNEISAAHDFLLSSKRTFVQGRIKQIERELKAQRQRLGDAKAMAATWSASDYRRAATIDPIQRLVTDLEEKLAALQ